MAYWREIPWLGCPFEWERVWLFGITSSVDLRRSGVPRGVLTLESSVKCIVSGSVAWNVPLGFISCKLYINKTRKDRY